jgi:hypothetical protein
MTPPLGVASQNPHRLYSYVSRGLYADQLERWLGFFPGERLHVIRSEDLFGRPQQTLDKLTRFLDLAPFQPAAFDRYAATADQRVSQLTPALRRRLSLRFAPHNQRLATLLGWPEAWSADHQPARESGVAQD